MPWRMRRGIECSRHNGNLTTSTVVNYNSRFMQDSAQLLLCFDELHKKLQEERLLMAENSANATAVSVLLFAGRGWLKVGGKGPFWFPIKLTAIGISVTEKRT
ncbi:paralemmin-3 [Platysternon megacephalum]|uniref:Paralemmin-3 n=1 Tax=Platysternon megacephalum TaxID=55544 RepID=A0A4D9E0I6_9SAUR|nr:paralemmin-3 [Platysternon megacephalum]